MPYFITDSADGCDGWATIKEDGEVIGCHQSKDAAIAQMVAVSLAEDMEPGGERALPDNYRPALSDDVPEGRACGNCIHYDDSRVMRDLAWCEKWDEFVSGAYYCNSWQARESRQTGASTPAPAEDQITGSDENKPGSAAGAGGGISLSDATRTALRNKVTEHNDRMAAEDRPAWTRARFGMLAAVYRRGSGAYSVSHRPGISRGAWAMARVNAFLFLLSAGRPKNANYVGDNDLLPADHPRSTRSADIPASREARAEVPQYMATAARRGLDLRADGFGGDGLTEQTIREARLIADGQMSDDKVIRANAWGARHAVDLQAGQNSDPDDPRWPGAGAVAHYLWGIDPLDPAPARAWLEREARRIQDERNQPMSVEKRSITIEDFELRQAGDGMSFSGYAAVFNSDSQPLPFIESIAPGAFAKSLRVKNNVRMLLNHDTSRVLGTTRSRTLRLAEDAKGLHVEADLPDTTYGRDLSISMQRGDVDSMSFGFSVPKNGDSWNEDGSRRTLREIRLHEVSVVTFPAYEATSAQVRDYSAIAARAQADQDAIAEAMEALIDGSLTDEQADLLRSVVDQATPKAEASKSVPISLLQKQLDLLSKSH